MRAKTIIENEHFTLRYHVDGKIVHHQFHRFLCGAPFRECLMAGIALMKEHGATKWLSDDRKNAAIPKEDAEWSTAIWRSEAIAAGWSHWAVVLPDKVTGQMSLQKIIGKFYGDGPVTVETFHNPADALIWLKTR